MMDIDIDFPTNFDPLEYFPMAIRASMVTNNKLTNHQCGIYFQPIPTDLLTGFAAIPYKEAEKLGFFKIDFLHLSLLDNFNHKEEIKMLMKKEPDWGMLQVPSVVEKLFHLHNYYDLLIRVKPHSVEDIADVLALMRPGKQYLLDDYLKDKKRVRKTLYKKPQREGGFYFKKSHAISYALTIVLQLHLIKAGIV